MEISRRIDWLTYSYHEVEKWHMGIFPTRDAARIGDEIKPLPRYRKAHELLLGGRVDISDDPHQGVVVNISGSQFQDWIANGVSFQHMVTHATEVGKVTRLDFATDCREDGSSDMSLWQKIEAATDAGLFRSRLSARARIIDKTKGGFTQYFGSYKSDQFIRCYDKAAESGLLKLAMKMGGILPVWTRIELVTKRDFAHNLASDMRYFGWQRAGANKLRKMISFPDIEGWGKLIDEEPVELTEVGRKPDKWRKWMETQVAPSIIEHAKNGKDRQYVLDWIQSIVAFVWDEI